jgi:hypothetical protein
MSIQFRELRGDVTVNVPAYAMAAAGTDREDVAIARVPWNLTLVAAYWTPQAAVTANGTNYSTLSLRNRKGDASGTALAATRSYAATNSVAFVTEAMTLSSTATDLQFATGDTITVQMIHTASGVVIPAGTITLHVRGR